MATVRGNRELFSHTAEEGRTALILGCLSATHAEASSIGLGRNTHTPLETAPQGFLGWEATSSRNRFDRHLPTCQKPSRCLDAKSFQGA